jgi:hypothetical protein
MRRFAISYGNYSRRQTVWNSQSQRLQIELKLGINTTWTNHCRTQIYIADNLQVEVHENLFSHSLHKGVNELAPVFTYLVIRTNLRYNKTQCKYMEKKDKFYTAFIPGSGPGSSVGIATGYGLDGMEIDPDGGGGEIFRICPDRSWGPPSLLYNG